MSVDDKLTYVVEQIGGINKTLEFQSKQLETHIKRTEMLENRMVPLEDQAKFTRGLVRVSLYLSSISGLATIILKVMRKM